VESGLSARTTQPCLCRVKRARRYAELGALDQTDKTTAAQKLVDFLKTV
jgi:hypothetical protein